MARSCPPYRLGRGQETGEGGRGLAEAGDGGEEVDGSNEKDPDSEVGLTEAVDEGTDRIGAGWRAARRGRGEIGHGGSGGEDAGEVRRVCLRI